MLLLAILIGLLGIIGSSVALFALGEALALRHADDDLHTFSTYWARAKRRHPIISLVLDLTVVGFCILLVALVVFLIGDLILDAW